MKRFSKKYKKDWKHGSLDQSQNTEKTAAGTVEH